MLLVLILTLGGAALIAARWLPLTSVFFFAEVVFDLGSSSSWEGAGGDAFSTTSPLFGAVADCFSASTTRAVKPGSLEIIT